MKCIKCGGDVDTKKVVYSKVTVCEKCIEKALKEFEDKGYIKEYEAIWSETIEGQPLN